MSSANSRQVAGDHYAIAGSLQHWDMVSVMLDNRYFEGCITKYATRWRRKNGLQDLEKALHFIDKLIEQVAAGIISAIPWNTRWNITAQHFKAPSFTFVDVKAKFVGFDMDAYYDANQLSDKEIELTKRVISWQTGRDLPAIKALIEDMMLDAAGGADAAYVNQD